MHNDTPVIPSSSSSDDAATLVLREAKRLHRAATCASPADSLPVLRRVIATATLRDMTLPELHRRRDEVRRKHILRTLAVEAGHDSWERYREVLRELRSDDLRHFDMVRGLVGYPNLWFASLEAAQAHAREHGGMPIPVGRQAVIVAESPSAG